MQNTMRCLVYKLMHNLKLVEHNYSWMAVTTVCSIKCNTKSIGLPKVGFTLSRARVSAALAGPLLRRPHKRACKPLKTLLILWGYPSKKALTAHLIQLQTTIYLDRLTTIMDAMEAGWITTGTSRLIRAQCETLTTPILALMEHASTMPARFSLALVLMARSLLTSLMPRFNSKVDLWPSLWPLETTAGDSIWVAFLTLLTGALHPMTMALSSLV